MLTNSGIDQSLPTISDSDPDTNSISHIVYLDVLRILAAFSIILLHVAAQNWTRVPYTSFEWKVMNFYDGAVRWAVPVFVMISGVLFLNPQKQITTKQLFFRYIPKIGWTYVIWSLLFFFYKYYGRVSTLEDIIKAYLFGHSFLWYLFLLIGLYLLTPILRCITANPEGLKYFIYLGFFSIFLIPRSMDFAAQFDIGFVQDAIRAATSIISYSHLQDLLNFPEYIYYFVLGYYLHTQLISHKKHMIIYLLGFLGFCFTIGLCEWYAIRNNAPSGRYYAPETLNVFLMSTAAFIFGKHVFTKIDKYQKLYKCVTYVAKCTFTIYLSHIFVQYELLYWFNLTSLSFSPIIGIPLIAVLIFLISLFIAVLINIFTTWCHTKKHVIK